MSILLIADIHLNDNPRDEYRHKFIEQLSKTTDYDHIYILGDLTDHKDRHSAQLVNRIVDHLYTLGRIAPVTILRGNHDYVEADNPFFEFVLRIKNITWINRPTQIGKWLWLPHTNNYKRDWEGVPINDPDINLIFAHNTFKGALSEHGKELDGIPATLFGGTQVISGDVHVPQRVGPVTYVGAPYTIDFGDDFKPRMLKLDGNKLTSIPCTGPQKRLLEMQTTAGDGFELTKGTRPANKGDIVKIMVKLRSGDYAQWGDIKASIEKWASKQGYEVYRILPVMDAKPRMSKQIKTSPKSDEEFLKGYSKQQHIDAATLAIGLELLKDHAR